MALLDVELMGFAVPYPDLHLLETANDGTSLNSSYTESGPRPGLPVADNALSTLEPVISAGQNADLVLHVLQGGNPGIRGNSVQLGYRYVDESSTQVRGWTACNGAVGWDNVTWVTAASTDGIDACTHPDSQKVVVVHGVAGVGQVDVSQYDPTTATWAAVATISAANTAMALCALPSGRILLYSYEGNMYRSDDAGDTWTLHARDTTDVNSDRARMAADSEGELLLVLLGVGTSTITQYASSDGGASWTEVETVASFGTSHTLLTLPDGRIAIVYQRDADDRPYCRVIGSPWSPISEATPVEISTMPTLDLVATVDPDGLIWVYGTEAAADRHLYAWASIDLGESFVAFDFGAATISSANDDSLRPLAAASSQGQVLVLHKWIASTDNHDPSVGALVLGGWSSAPYSFATEGIAARCGFGPHATLAPRLYLPIELPQDCGWTLAGTAGAGTLSTGRLAINVAAQVCSYEYTLGVDLQHVVVFGVEVVSGGTLAARDISVNINVDDGTTDAYRLDVNFTATQFRVMDGKAGTTLATITVDTTTEIEICMSVQEAVGFVLYRRPYEAAWTEAWSGALTSSGAGGTPRVIFGAIVNNTSHARWRFVGSCPQGLVAWPPTGTGRPISSLPIPLHSETSLDQDGVLYGPVARLSAIGGSGALVESYTVEAEHDYPGDAIYPQVSPSPAAKWRTFDQSEQIRSWLLPDPAVLFGEHSCIIAIGCNFRTAYLETEQAGWTTIATLDLAQGFAGINYSLTAGSSMLVAGAGGVAPARYLQEGELAGGYAVIEVSAGAGQVARRIAWNTAGVWSSSGSVRQARVYLEDVTGSEDQSGQCDLVWPSGVFVQYSAAIAPRSRWRIRIPANQVTPDSWYEAGILVPGSVRSPGAAPDWGHSRECRPQASERRTAYGTSHRREIGPPLRDVSFGWTSGTDWHQIRTSTAPDHIGISGEIPFATAEDVGMFLEGLQLLTRSGEIPVVALMSLPAADGMIIDRTLLNYGRLSTSIATDHELGEEGVGEVVRPAIVTVEGIG